MNRKAIALLSGGLDSCLAAHLVKSLGVEVLGVHFVLPVSSPDPEKNAGLKHALDESRRIGIECRIVVMGEDFLEVLLNPKYGYGSGINPCTDCHALMLKKTREMMEAEGASFVITGEVLGQRPMSQLARKLKIVEKESGLDGLLLRPLSAQHLEETIPEKEGWIDRTKLLGIKGRRRREQMDIARATGLEDYMSPAGGCILTDKHFGKRVREHLDHDVLNLDDFGFLKIGRHFRLPDGSKLVVGRNEDENIQIENLLRPDDVLIIPSKVKGPDVVLRGSSQSEEILHLACEIAASYCDGKFEVEMDVKVGDQVRTIVVERKSRDEYKEFIV